MGKKEGTPKFNRKEHAKGLHMRNVGPSAGNPIMIAEATTEKKLKKLKKVLGTSMVAPAAPRRDVPSLPAKRPVAPEKKPFVASSTVEPLAVYNYVCKHYLDVNKVNWSAVADKFRLSDHKTAQRKYTKHAASLTAEEVIWPGIVCLEQKYKKNLLEIVAQYDGPRVRQLDVDQWKVKIDEQLLAQHQANEGAPNANLDDIPKLSEKSYKKILLFLVPKKVNSKKHLTEGRVAASDEPRNPFTLACAVQALMHDRPQAKELVDSSDMFTLFVDPSTGKSKAVRMTQATWEALRAEHLGPGYADDPDSKTSSKKPGLAKVGIPTYACIQASGDVRAIVIIFIDSAIPRVAVGKRYRIYPLQCNGCFENPVHNAFVFAAMVNADFEEDCLMQQIWCQIIIPKSEKTAADLIQAAMTPIQEIPEPSSSRSAPRPSSGIVPAASSSSRSVVSGERVYMEVVFCVKPQQVDVAQLKLRAQVAAAQRDKWRLR